MRCFDLTPRTCVGCFSSTGLEPVTFCSTHMRRLLPPWKLKKANNGGFCSTHMRRLLLAQCFPRLHISSSAPRTCAGCFGKHAQQTKLKRSKRAKRICVMHGYISNLRNELPFFDSEDVRYAHSAVRTPWAMHGDWMFAPSWRGQTSRHLNGTKFDLNGNTGMGKGFFKGFPGRHDLCPIWLWL